jgi:SAM-dependent methyltransferase
MTRMKARPKGSGSPISDAILDGYAVAATPDLIARYEAFDTADLLAPVFDCLPAAATRVVDLGAGTGRDAAWFARAGHEVVAVEPVEPLRTAGMALHENLPICWIDDVLPLVVRLRRALPFGLVLANGVWHHLEPSDQTRAIARVARLLQPRGRMVMSLRHGPGPAGRHAFPVSAADIAAQAERVGLSLMRRVETGSIQPGSQAAGVKWAWLAFERAS